jgi:hypothetical protein
MKMISRRAHGFLDYFVGVLLIFLPKIFGFDTGGIESRIPVILGIAALIYSVVTNYELGLFKLLPFRVHLALDVMSGLLLAASPWLFQFADRVWGPHLAFGLIELGAVWMTRTASSEHRATGRGAPAHS